MRTFKKAKEIFNSQINKPANEATFSLKAPTTSLQKIHSTTRLYKLYLYNKILQKGLKKLNLFNLFKTSKVKPSFYKVLIQINKVSTPIKKQRINLLINTMLAKIAFSKNINFTNAKNSLIRSSYNKKLQNFFINLNFRLFSNFFEYKIAYLLKTKKKFSSFRNDTNIFLNYLKKSKKVISIKSTLKNFILKLTDSFRKIFINLRWSKRSVSELMQRLQLVFCIYSIAFLILLCNSFCCLSQYDYLKGKIANFIRLDKNVVHAFIQSFKNYSPIFSIFYVSLFLKPKNTLRLPKNTIGHLGVCAIMSFLNFGLELSQTLINYLVKSSVLFTDIYFCRFFIKTDKKLRFLRSFTNILTSETDLTYYYFSKLFKASILFDINENRYLSNYIKYNCSPGRYERFIEKILYEAGVPMLEGSGRFIKSYIFLPFYLILLTSLLYNCCYYIIYNKQPYIPIVTNLVKKLTPNNQND
jgi:hypothetical protein